MYEAAKIRKLEFELKRMKENLRVGRMKYEILADRTDCGVWEYHSDSKCLYQSKKLSGKYEKENLVIPDYRNTVIGWGIVHPEDIPIFEAYCDSMDRGEKRFQYELRAVTDESSFQWLRYIGVTIFDSQGNPTKVIGKTLNVTEEKVELLDLQRRAYQDSMTGLMNKEHTKELVEQMLKTVDGETKFYALYIIDIDNFKQINDHLGHLAGDEVLIKFSNTLLAGFSAGDVVGRIGGDEFLVFSSSVQNEKEASEAADKIMKRCSSFFVAGKNDLTVSIGIAIFPRDAVTYEALYKSADIALYQAKRSGKNCFCVYNKNEKYEAAIGETKRKLSENRIKDKHRTNIEKKIFDYCFELISREDNILESIENILSEIGIYYDLDRVFLIDYDFTLNKSNVLKKWVKGKLPFSEQEMLLEYVKSWKIIENLFHSGKHVISYHGNLVNDENIEKEDAVLEIKRPDFYSQELLQMLDMNSILQFPILDGEQVIGIISYECRKEEKNWNEQDIATLSSITKMIASYLLRLKSKVELADEILYTGCAMDSQKLTYYVIDSETYDVLYISRYANELFPEIRVGKKCYQSVMGEKEPCANCPLKGLQAGQKQYAQEVYSQKYDTWFTSSVSVVDKEKNQYVLCWTDITTFLERVMSTDQLTGTLSYDKFRAEALKRISDKNKKYAVAYFGIRDFSKINDELGFEAGDVVIKTLARRIMDTISENEIVCRTKGDDFIFLMENNEIIKVTDRVEHICLTLKILLANQYPSLAIHGICGIYEVSNADYSISKILDKANQAKKVAFATPGEEYSIFVYTKEYEMQQSAQEEMVKNIKYALQHNEFKVFLQPKVSMKSGKIGGAEALVRWIKEDGTIVSPGKFIPLTEKNGMVVDIDEAVYKSLFRQMKIWLDAGKNVPVISVNVSRLHFLDDKFPEYFFGLMKEFQIPKEYIEIEITESVFFDNMERMIDMIATMRNMGLAISMDDFGTGYSTLSLMKSLPIDVLKIDGSFFMHSEMDEKNKAIISSIVHLAKCLNLQIVCEGIETNEQVAYIKEEECDLAQGFFYYKPMSIEDFEKIMNHE